MDEHDRALSGRTQRRYAHPLDDQREFFDTLITDEWQTYLNPAWDRVRRFEVDWLLRQIRPRRVLDVGCGSGFHDVVIAETAGVERVVGIDYSAKSIETADREYPHSKVRRFVADLAEFAEDDFDLVVSFQVIEHLRDPAAFLRACRDRSHPGGWVATFTPNWRRLGNRMLEFAARRPLFADTQHFMEFTVGDLARLGEQCGLSVIDSIGYGLSVPVPTPRGLRVIELGTRAGSLVPAIADKIGVLFEIPRAG